MEYIDYLIDYLLKEQPSFKTISIPNRLEDKKKLLRSLMNVRPPISISSDFLDIQDKYLQQELSNSTITDIKQLTPIRKGIYLWKGDITKLKIDAIVNACNSKLLGCFIPCHKCIDNAIHSFSGIQLRLECNRIMENQKTLEPTGRAKITKGYNLPSKYVIHTVGPIVNETLTEENINMLKSCYISCLELAENYNLTSIAFCCISTGEFHFPNEIAGQIAVNTVTDHLSRTKSKMEVVFNVFKDKDFKIYQKLLTND